MAVIPFENETPFPELTNEFHLELRKTLSSRLGLREASEGRANAIVRGRITRYEVDIPIGISADPGRSTSARRKLQLVVDVEIFDQENGRTLYERTGVSGEGEYAEREEPNGRKLAIQKVISDIIEGAQSQW
ncbi:MAG: LPS assembly lipoprotein LptE [Gemmatimonadota bacterium]